MKSYFKKPDIIHKEYIPAEEVYSEITRQKKKFKVKTYCLDNIREELKKELEEELKTKYKRYYIRSFTVEFHNLYLLEVKGEIYK